MSVYLGEPLDIGADHDTGVFSRDLVRDLVERPFDDCLVGPDGDNRQTCALPEIVMVSFGRSDVVPSEPVLDATQHHALVFE